MRQLFFVPLSHYHREKIICNSRAVNFLFLTTVFIMEVATFLSKTQGTQIFLAKKTYFCQEGISCLNICTKREDRKDSLILCTYCMSIETNSQSNEHRHDLSPLVTLLEGLIGKRLLMEILAGLGHMPWIPWSKTCISSVSSYYLASLGRVPSRIIYKIEGKYLFDEHPYIFPSFPSFP